MTFHLPFDEMERIRQQRGLPECPLCLRYGPPVLKDTAPKPKPPAAPTKTQPNRRHE